MVRLPPSFLLILNTAKNKRGSITDKKFCFFSQGATAAVVKKYDAMASSPAWKNPLSWTEPSFTLDAFDLVFLPGGHEKSVRQIIDNTTIHRHLISFFPQSLSNNLENVRPMIATWKRDASKYLLRLVS